MHATTRGAMCSTRDASAVCVRAGRSVVLVSDDGAVRFDLDGDEEVQAFAHPTPGTSSPCYLATSRHVYARATDYVVRASRPAGVAPLSDDFVDFVVAVQEGSDSLERVPHSALHGGEWERVGIWD